MVEKAIFKTTIPKGGRITIPVAEMEALELSEGDTIQVILWKVNSPP